MPRSRKRKRTSNAKVQRPTKRARKSRTVPSKNKGKKRRNSRNVKNNRSAKRAKKSRVVPSKRKKTKKSNTPSKRSSRSSRSHLSKLLTLLTPSESMEEIRSIINEVPLLADIQTSGRGRTRNVIIAEINQRIEKLKASRPKIAINEPSTTIKNLMMINGVGRGRAKTILKERAIQRFQSESDLIERVGGITAENILTSPVKLDFGQEPQSDECVRLLSPSADSQRHRFTLYGKHSLGSDQHFHCNVPQDAVSMKTFHASRNGNYHLLSWPKQSLLFRDDLNVDADTGLLIETSSMDLDMQPKRRGRKRNVTESLEKSDGQTNKRIKRRKTTNTKQVLKPKANGTKRVNKRKRRRSSTATHPAKKRKLKNRQHRRRADFVPNLFWCS